MNEIYPLWVAAHGIMIVAPVNWYHAPTALKGDDRRAGLRQPLTILSATARYQPPR
jgi:hypothetical protein